MSNEKKAKRKDIIVVAVILLLVAVLLVIGRRSCTITLTTPEDMEVSYVWCEVYNDGRVAVCTDAGGVSQHEYVVRYKAVGGAGESVVLFACIDTETGDEMCDRVAYKITTNGLGFLTATPVDIPDTLEDVTLPALEIFETDTQVVQEP